MNFKLIFWNLKIIISIQKNLIESKHWHFDFEYFYLKMKIDISFKKVINWV